MEHIKGIIGLALIVILVWGGCELINQNGWRYQDDQIRESKIFSLRTSLQTEGSFFLGIGSIDGVDYYIFYRQTESGGLLREKLRTSDCILYEGFSVPKIIEYGQRGYRLSGGDTLETNFHRGGFSPRYHEIYIPKGTLTERVNDINLN